jgi:signal transduction histidine kinase
VAATIAGALDLVAAALPRNVALVRQIHDVGVGAADPVQLQQVVMNLAANAVDAIGAKDGRVTVRLDRVTRKRVPHARLVVEDDGEGMRAEVLERIFEPFFTTKEAGKGTGMGLAVVHGIVAAHGGHIEAESRPGAGARFTMWLPLTGAAPTP